MLTAGLDILEGLLHARGYVAIDLAEDHLVEAEDGVKRRPEFVTHAGEELRLVPARHFQLAALLRDLAEQARVLDRKRRLRRERLQQGYHLRRKLAGAVSIDDQAAKQVIFAQKRHCQQRPIAQPDEHFPDPALVNRFVADISDLDRLAGDRHPS